MANFLIRENVQLTENCLEEEQIARRFGKVIIFELVEQERSREGTVVPQFPTLIHKGRTSQMLCMNFSSLY